MYIYIYIYIFSYDGKKFQQVFLYILKVSGAWDQFNVSLLNKSIIFWRKKNPIGPINLVIKTDLIFCKVVIYNRSFFYVVAKYDPFNVIQILIANKS